MGVLVYSDSVWSLPLSSHATAQFSDGTLLVVGYDGTNLVYATSTNQGTTWSATTAITAVTLTTLAQVHFDLCQNGNTVYGFLLNGNSGGPSIVPFKLVYSGGSITVTVGSATANIAGITVAGTNPGAGNTYASCTYDADHNLMHVGVESTGATNSGPQLYAFTTALALSYSLTGQVSTTIAIKQVCSIVYVRGTLYIYADGLVASTAPTASAYGALSANTSVRSSVSSQGVCGSVDTTQASTQPVFSEANGTDLSVITYNGTAWTVTTIISSDYFGSGVQCGVGTDMYVVSGNGVGTNYYWKRTNGVWGTQQTIDASNGDRVGVPCAAGTLGGILLLAYVHGAPANVYALAIAMATSVREAPLGSTVLSAAVGVGAFSGAGTPVNLLTQNQADVETDLIGFYPQGVAASGQTFAHGGVTLSRDTAPPGGAWHGASSLKFVSDGGGAFQNIEVRIPVSGQFPAGASLTLSAWIYSVAGGPTLRFYLQADTGSIGTVGNITLLAGWNRYVTTKTLPTPITQLYFALRWDTGSTAQAVTLWADGLQVELAAVASGWHPGGTPAGGFSGGSVLGSGLVATTTIM